MFTTHDLPATFRPSPDGSHACGHPDCGFYPDQPAGNPSPGVPSTP